VCGAVQVELEFLPWLTQQALTHLEQEAVARAVLQQLVADAVAQQVGYCSTHKPSCAMNVCTQPTVLCHSTLQSESAHPPSTDSIQELPRAHVVSASVHHCQPPPAGTARHMLKLGTAWAAVVCKGFPFCGTSNNAINMIVLVPHSVAVLWT